MPDTPTPVPRPVFVLGVTGQMDFDQLPKEQRDAVEKAVQEKVFRYVLTEEVIPELGHGLGLKPENVVLLSSLAPGADTVVVRLARERGIRVQAPLPFPIDQYVKATTFESLSDDEREELRQQLHEMKEDAFHVLLLEDMELSSADLDRKVKDDLGQEDRRNLRFRAAGEYVARHCHLLIALTGDDYRKDTGKTEKPEELLPPVGVPARAGSAVVVFAKRQGLTRDLLAAVPPLNWTDTGPVFHVYTPRPDQGRNPPDPPAAGTLTRLHTFDAYSEKNPHWKRDMRHQFRQMTKRMKRFQEEPDDKSEGKELSGLLQTDLHREFTIAEDYLDHLDRLARVYHRADRLAIDYQSASQRVLRWLFWLTLVAALLAHLAAHWHSTDHEGHGVAWWRASLVALALAAFLLAVWKFRRAKQRRLDETQYDYRALAEGLRVQFYWAAAGLGQSVPANYMQRQRNEMEWIRKAIGALAAPYFRVQTWFRALSNEQKLLHLEAVAEKWVGGQLEYYGRRWKEDDHTLHFWHRFGLCWAVAGVLHAVVLAVWLLPPCEHALGHLSPTRIAELRSVGLFLFGCYLLAWGVSWWHAALKKWSDLCRKADKQRKPRPAPREFLTCLRGQFALGFRGPWVVVFPAGQFLGLVCRRFFNRPMWTEEEAQYEGKIGGYLLTALLITTASIGLTLGLFGRTPLLPTAHACWIITLGSCLVIGALAVAWAEKNLTAEQSRQYSAMAALFHAAYRRIDSNLKAANAALTDRDVPTFEKRIAVVQDLLFQVGLQALDEHAEWLMLHRARPLEPVMAG